MKIIFYGTRGSIPVPDPDFQEFGGNTTCVEVIFGDGSIVILDAGSGLRNMGKALMARGHQQYDNIYIALSHFHWDHIQGFPFFEPAYDPRRHFTITTAHRKNASKNLEEIFETQMQEEFFPVPLKQMGASIHFDQLREDVFCGPNFQLKVLQHSHPGIAFSYRIEAETGVLVFCTDIEHGEQLDERIIKFSEGADLLIHDAQYTPEELTTKRGWGHSSWVQAIEVAKQAGVNLLALTHHDPEHNDSFLRQVEKQCQSVFPYSFLAREKMQVEFNRKKLP